MSVKNKMFQPGAVLHEVIVGAFRSAGTSFEAWCKQNNIHTSTARMATYGQSGGDKGQALLNQIIDAAGRDVVALSYKARIERHAAEVAA
ncbi:hypothetical protein [Candidatus Rhodobacter oscarellae]|nr:hypothetical protein [Candidatus Rhodobacter lobularis]